MEISYKNLEIIKTLLEIKKELILSFSGSSMVPTIKDGTKVKLIEVSVIECNKIYIFLDEDKDSVTKLVCHRLVEIVGNNYIFKGDNRALYDKPITRNCIIGGVEVL